MPNAKCEDYFLLKYNGYPSDLAEISIRVNERYTELISEISHEFS
jgi:hypothetical protein